MKKAKFSIPALVIAALMLLSSNHSKAQPYNIGQTLSDGAQRNTIAFDGLAFLTGNFCACSFIPPGKVADYFGFQFLRDNDISHMGHTTDFNTVIANNLLYVLDSTQKAQLISLAIAQVPDINQYAYERFPLIDAFIRMRDNNMPAGSTGLDKDAVKTYSGKLYRLDGKISIQRAKLYASLIKTFTAKQKHYLDSVSKLGMKNMPVLPEQFDKRPLNNNQFVAVMSFAGDIYSWYVGNVDADVYFCPERQGNYFGGFYIKDAPAMGNHGYSIDTNLTQNGGVNFLKALNQTQASLITSLVDSQSIALYKLVDRRTDISKLLRGYLASDNIDTAAVMSLSETYGQLDGEISYYYATNFSKAGWTLTNAQRDTLHKLRNLDKYPCVGAYLYSDSIGYPEIINTDFFFKTISGIIEHSSVSDLKTLVYPNPFSTNVNISYTLQKTSEMKISITDIIGQHVRDFIFSELAEGEHNLTWDGTDNNSRKLSKGVYFCRLMTASQNETVKLIFVN